MNIISPEIFKYLLMALFMTITYYLSYKGMKKTKDIKSFSIGNKDLNPYIIGITMAASISSTATFVINPGFIYTHGLSAYIHYGLAASFGILTAFLLLSKGFRKVGELNGAITIPHWIFKRFESRSLSLFFAFMNLVSITFIVLILVGCSILLSSLFPISQKVALIAVLLFVFSYVLIGGAYAHVYTNSFQGMMMILISLFLFFNGLKYFDGGFFSTLENVSVNYASMFNPDSSLYYDFVSVFLSGFVITFALMLQPHILTKILYIKEDKDVNKFIVTTTVVGLCFSLMLFVGFYAKLSGAPITGQDKVVAQYIFHEFSTNNWGSYFLSFISITLLAAGMSTLDGILVSLSSMAVNDIYRPLCKDNKFSEKKALYLSRMFLVAIGIFSLILAWNPPKLVGLFAQKGVYALAAASVVPILIGVFSHKVKIMKSTHTIVFLSSAVGFFGHLFLNTFFGFTNPAVSSMYAIFASFGVYTLYLAFDKYYVRVQSFKSNSL